MGGGAEAFARAAAEHVEKGEPERALYLAEMAIAAEPQNRDAQIARLTALELLLERSGGVNHYEVEWLKHRIGEIRDDLGL